MGEPSRAGQSGAVAFQNLPDDLVVHLARFLPLMFQFRLWIASQRTAIWKARSILPSDCNLVKGFYDKEEDADDQKVRGTQRGVAMLFAVSKHPALLANLREMDIKHWDLTDAHWIPIISELGICSRLTGVAVFVLGDATATLLGILLSKAPLQRLEIACKQFSREEIMKAPLSHLRHSLVTLNLYASARDPSTPEFLEFVATNLPNLRSLLIASYNWEPLKKLENLTHLYISTSEGNKWLDTSTVEATELTVARLLETCPPKVGSNLLIEMGREFRSVLENTLDPGTQPNLPVIKAILAKGKYNLSFSHQLTYWGNTKSRVVFLRYCPWNVELFDYFFREQPSLLTWRDDAESSIFALLLYVHQFDPAMDEILLWLFGWPWQEAMKLGLDPVDLLTRSSGGPARKSVLFSMIPSFSKSNLEFVLSRPDVFGDIRALRDGYSRTLLFKESKLVEELIAAGVDWRVKDAFGFNALENAAFNRTPDFVEAIVGTLSDAEFASWCTPTVWAGLAGFDLADRMLALVPRVRWQPCIEAALHMALILQMKPVFHEREEVRAMQLLAWVSPIDWDFAAQFVNKRDLIGLQTVHLAFMLEDDNNGTLQEAFDAIATEFGSLAAQQWAQTKDSKGRIVDTSWSMTSESPEVPNV